MATISCFEEIQAWQKAREMNRAVYSATRSKGFASDIDLRRQIRRASVSAMSNIAEGFERDGSKEFLNFLSIAKGSVGEVESQLYVALDEDYISQAEFKQLKVLTSSTKRLIAGFMHYLRTSKQKGVKFVRETPESL
jgi:four helix bundle protein